ncbi:MAG: glycosyltransferase [Parvularculaceae bacterium]
MYSVLWRKRRLIFLLAGIAVIGLAIAGAAFAPWRGVLLTLAAAGAAGLAVVGVILRTAGRKIAELSAALSAANTKNSDNPSGPAPTPPAAAAPAKSAVRDESRAIDKSEDLREAETLLDRALANVRAARREHAHERRPLPTIAEHDGAPQISVVVPMYNERRHVAETIESLRRQTFKDFEAIIVDDASTDGSMAVAMGAAKDDDRFHFARHAVNSGLSAARNTGLRLACAPLITFLDSDDFFFPDALETRLTAIKQLVKNDTAADRAYAGVYCRLITMPQNITLDEAERRIKRRDVSCKVVDFVNSSGECPFNAHAPMLFTEIVRAHGGFDETLRFGCEDWDLWQRIMRNGYAFAPTNRLSGVYRRKRGSMVKDTPAEHLDAAKMLFDRARAPVNVEDVSENAPFVFAEGLHAYEDRARFMKRTAQYAVINAFANANALNDTLHATPAGAAAFVDPADDMRPFVEAGIRRAIAIDEPSIEKLQMKFDALTNGVVDLLRASIALSAPIAKAQRQQYDAIFLPQSQAQVRAMASAAKALMKDGRRIVFVTTEVETGDQGQRAAIAAEGLPSLTFNRACLMKIGARAFAVMRPYSSLIRDAIPAGAKIVEIERADRPVSYPDENAPREDVTCASPEEAASRLASFIASSDFAEIGDRISTPADGPSAPAPYVISKEESFHQAPDFDAIATLKDKWRGERCIIIGNGPSINKTDLTKLRNEFTFAVNGIFYKKAEMGFDPTFYVVEDSSVMKENIDAIKAYQGEYKLFPTLYRKLHPKEDNVFFFQMNRGFYEQESPSFCVPRFSVDAARRVYCGQSVTHINLQLAYYFGFSEVYLIGVDFSYVIPESAIRKGDIILSTEDDPNHFHGDYFGKGKTWKDPKLHRVKLNYELARDMFEADERKVYNATKGGALEVFERADYDAIFG